MSQDIIKTSSEMRSYNAFQQRNKDKLEQAIQNDDVHMLSSLIEEGVDVTSYCSFDLLRKCIKQKSNLVLKILVENNIVSPNTMSTNEDRITPLTVCMKSNNIEGMSILLEAGADPNCGETMDEPPLLYARRGGNQSMLNLLLLHKANPNIHPELAPLARLIVKNNRQSMLEQALLDDDMQTMISLIAEGADINGYYFKKSLGSCIKQKSNFILRELLQNKIIDPNTLVCDGTCEPYLSIVLRTSHDLERAKLLLEFGANPDVSSYGNGTLLMFAINAQDNKMLALLLEHKANPNGIEHQHIVPLVACIKSGNLEGVRLLLEGGASPDKLDNFIESPLLCAVEAGNNEMLSLLLHHKATPNSTSIDTDSALLTAVKSDNIEGVKLLLQFGADPNEGNFWEVPVMVATERANSAILALLLEHQGNPNASNPVGCDTTPLEIAIKGGNFEGAKLLAEHGAIVQKDKFAELLKKYDHSLFKDDFDIKMATMTVASIVSDSTGLVGEKDDNDNEDIF